MVDSLKWINARGEKGRLRWEIGRINHSHRTEDICVHPSQATPTGLKTSHYDNVVFMYYKKLA